MEVVPEITYEPTTRTAARKFPNERRPTTTRDIFEKEGSLFMHCRFPDGEEYELVTCTVAAWNSTEAAEKKTNLVWSDQYGSEKIAVLKKMLNANNPGVIISINGSQKVQVAIKDFDGGVDEAAAWMKKHAIKYSRGKISIGDIKAARPAPRRRAPANDDPSATGGNGGSSGKIVSGRGGGGDGTGRGGGGGGGGGGGRGGGGDGTGRGGGGRGAGGDGTGRGGGGRGGGGGGSGGGGRGGASAARALEDDGGDERDVEDDEGEEDEDEGEEGEDDGEEEEAEENGAEEEQEEEQEEEEEEPVEPASKRGKPAAAAPQRGKPAAMMAKPAAAKASVKRGKPASCEPVSRGKPAARDDGDEQREEDAGEEEAEEERPLERDEVVDEDGGEENPEEERPRVIDPPVDVQKKPAAGKKRTRGRKRKRIPEQMPAPQTSSMFSNLFYNE